MEIKIVSVDQSYEDILSECKKLESLGYVIESSLDTYFREVMLPEIKEKEKAKCIANEARERKLLAKLKAKYE